MKLVEQAESFSAQDMLAGFRELESMAAFIREHRKQAVEDHRTDVVGFFDRVLGFGLTEYQKELVRLFEENQFVAARWCRQSGKSTIIAGLLLHYAIAHPGCRIAVVGPSWRQTKLNIQKMADFLPRLPRQLYLKPQRTRLVVNGSTIEAFPNNPSTIRGPTLDVVWWDEANFTANDQELYDAILFTTITTKGKLVCTSTPWNRDSLFWKMCNDKGFGDFKVSHVSYEQAREPNGPLTAVMIEAIKKQLGDDSEAWKREMMAEWAENESVWLPQGIIRSCVGTVESCGEDLQLWDTEISRGGYLFAGVDLAQVVDFSVLSVFEQVNDMVFLRYLKIYDQPTWYGNVLEHLKTLQDRWGGFLAIKVDITKDGPSLIVDMQKAGIQNAEGVHLSLPKKSEIAGILKQRMTMHKLFYPDLSWERPSESNIYRELNVERYRLRDDGRIELKHPAGTHDDVFWSIALAAYAASETKTADITAMRFG